MTRPMKAPRLMVREFNPSISFAECTALLTGLPVGSYLVRLSAGRPGDYVLAVKKPPTGEAVQIIVQYQPASLSQRMPGSFLLDGVSYPSLAEIRARNSDLLRESLPLFLARHLSQCAPLSDRGRREAHLQLHIRRISQRSLRAYNQGFAGNAYNFGIDEPLSPRSSSQAAALAYGSIRHSGDEQSFFTDAQPPASTNNTAAMAYGSDPGYVPIARPSGSALDTNDSYVLPLATDANTSYVISSTKSPSTSSTSSSAGEAAASPRPQQQPIGIGALHHGSFSSLPAGVTVTSSTPGMSLSRWLPLASHSFIESRFLVVVRAWLKGLDLEKLANLFEREELYDLESISDLSREDIQDMVSKEGLTKGALSRLFRAVTQLKDPRYLAASGIGQGASASQPQLDYTYSTTTQNPDAAAIMAMAAGATASPPPQPSPQQGGGDALRSSHTDMKETFVSDIQLKERVGHGFFGVVYRGLWQDAIDVALKQVSRDDAEGVKEFEAEVAMLLALRHPNVIRFYGIYAASLDTQYMVLEWANGGSLYSFISDPKTEYVVSYRHNAHNTAHSLTHSLISQLVDINLGPIGCRRCTRHDVPVRTLASDRASRPGTAQPAARDHVGLRQLGRPQVHGQGGGLWPEPLHDRGRRRRGRRARHVLPGQAPQAAAGALARARGVVRQAVLVALGRVGLWRHIVGVVLGRRQAIRRAAREADHEVGGAGPPTQAAALVSRLDLRHCAIVLEQGPGREADLPHAVQQPARGAAAHRGRGEARARHAESTERTGVRRDRSVRDAQRSSQRRAATSSVTRGAVQV